MELSDFFETNSVALEVIELFDEFREEKAKKTALNAVRRELGEEYSEEGELRIIFQMALYWCGLKSNFIDEKSRSFLEGFTESEVKEAFDEEDGRIIADLLTELLKTEPIKPERKKIDYSNPGSKNWKKGDIFAYRLDGEEAEKAGLAGKYALWYVLDIEKKTARTNNVYVYLLLYFGDDINLPLEEIFDNSVFLPVCIYRDYQYKFIDSHHEYPSEYFLLLGNLSEINPPKK